MRWSPADANLVFATSEELKEHLEFVGVEGNVEVYVDRRTGKKLYAGRTLPILAPDQEAEVARLRADGAELLKPIMGKILGRQELGFFERRKRKAAVELLEQLLAIAPRRGRALDPRYDCAKRG